MDPERHQNRIFVYHFTTKEFYKKIILNIYAYKVSRELYDQF